MPIDRRTALTGIASILGATASAGPFHVQTSDPPPPRTGRRLRKIATEEAWIIPEIAEALRQVVRGGGPSLDLALLRGIYDAPPGTPARFLPQLLDVEGERLAEMDAYAVDVHLLSLTAPGVQMFDSETGTRLARLANDRMAELVRRHPKRLAALASFAPQDPAAAAKHPRAPSDGMAEPFRDYRLESAVWGYGVEVGTHALRLMMSGVLDRFPGLRIVIGHMGEALPFWMWRLDFMGAPGARAAGRANQLKPSEYFRRNFAITTSGVEDPLALRFCIDKLGIDSVMWAIDYPYQATAPAVAFLESAALSEHEREQIAHGNAERIFRIPASSKTVD